MIKYLEASPDSTLALVTGEKLLVRESCETLAEHIATYRATLLRDAWPDARVALAADVAAVGAQNALTSAPCDAAGN